MVEALRLKHAPVAQRKSGGLLSRGSGVRIPPGAFSTHWNAAGGQSASSRLPKPLFQESLSLARGAAGYAPPEGTVLQHGPGERRAASGVRRPPRAGHARPHGAEQRESLSFALGAAERASPERTAFTHGLGEDRALSGVRRASGGQSRLAARSPSTEQARGVTGGIRTHDHRDHNPGLYQLSYGHRASDSVVRAGRLLAQRPDYRRLSDQC